MPTVKIKSNWNQFSKRLRKLPDMIEEAGKGFVEHILKLMRQDMINEINAQRSEWLDGGAMDVWSNSANIEKSIRYELSESGKTGRIVIESDPIVLANGDEVNPFFFIEFGYGIIGQNNPALYASSNGWVYNVNNHTSFIIYAYDNIAGEKETVKTEGTKGINFFYNTVAKYRNNWKKYAEEYLSKVNINGN